LLSVVVVFDKLYPITIIIVIRAVELKRVKELIEIKKINAVKKLMHTHKFYETEVLICNCTAVI